MRTGVSLALSALIASALLASPVSTSAAKAPKRCFEQRINLDGATRSDDPFLIGRIGRDVIHGRSGNDGLFGLPGNDRLCGGRGNDTIDGGSGFDRVNGGRGYDICRSAERAYKCEEFDA